MLCPLTDRYQAELINAKQFAGVPDGQQFAGIPDGLVVPFWLVQGLIERWYLGKRMGADEFAKRCTERIIRLPSFVCRLT